MSRSSFLIENNLAVITSQDKAHLSLNFGVDGPINFMIKEGFNVDYLISDINRDINIYFDVLENAKLILRVFTKNVGNNINITANLGKNSQMDVFFADFASAKENMFATINLVGNDSKMNWHLASLASSKDDKKISVSFNHYGLRTSAYMDNYGVTTMNSKLEFSGIGHIFNGAHKASTRQNAKIIVFDNDSVAKASPILRIDEDDIVASHAASVGRLNDDHIFYLCSRGLTLSKARELISYGYLKPIMNGFDDEDVAKEVLNTIESRI